MTVAVVGDGAVGLLAALSARQMGAERIIAMSRHEKRQRLALEFGATDIVTERGDEGVARIKDLTKSVGAHAVLECVGPRESMMQAIRSTRRGGYVGYAGVPHDVELKGEELFFAHVHLHGGPAPVRRFLPKLIDLGWTEKINPGKVFDLTLPLNIVKLWPGKTEQQKTRLAEAITKDVMEILRYGDESVSVAMEEVKSQDCREKVSKPDIQKKWNKLYKKPGYDVNELQRRRRNGNQENWFATFGQRPGRVVH